MIKNFLRSTILTIAIACTTGAFAQTFTQTNGSTHSQMRDKSNVLIDTSWNINLQTSAGNSDLFINNMVITGGAGYDPLIDIQTQSGGFDFNGGGANHYTFGTAISGDNDWNFAGAFHNGNIDSAVADGIYDFNLDILGGGDDLASDTLASFGLHVDVFQKIDIDTTMTATPGTIKEGGPGTLVSMTVTNNMTGRNFTSKSWWVSGFGDGLGNFLSFDDFSGDWFDKVIVPGGVRTDDHSMWHAELDTPIGTYTSFNGVIGDVNEGDFIFLTADQQAQVNVIVPEPASFAVLGLGALALIRRRKKSTQ